MTDPVPVRRCGMCENDHPIVLYDGDGRICAYCTADVREQREHQIEKRKLQARAKGKELSLDKVTPPPIEQDPIVIKARQQLAHRELQRRRLLPFIEASKPKYLAGWVHKDICARLEKFSQDVVEGKSPRLMLFMPPRHGKSQIASIDFPAWHLGRNPDHEIIACSYSASLAMGFSRKVRAQLRTPEYAAVFPECQLDPDVQAAEGWQTTKGGGYVPAGVSGPITGKGAHVMIIDDPVKNREEAESETTQAMIMDWYSSTALTRLAPGGGLLVIMTRWHDMDLAGQLVDAINAGGDEWEIISYPAIAVEDEQYRKAGEALHPERYPLSALQRIKNAIMSTTGVRDWEALYQQNPVSNEGDYFTKNDVKYYMERDLADKKLRYYAAWDFAVGKRDQNDYSVGIVVGVDQNDNIYIVDLWRGKWSSNELVEKILDLYEKWKPSITGLEKGVIEMSIGPFLEKRIAERKLWEMLIEELKPGRQDKEARARAIQGRMQQGKVFFPADGHFTATLIAEMLRFPSGQHDDQVDALAWIGRMLTVFHGLRDPTPEKKKSWRDKIKKFAGSEDGKKRKSAMAS